MPNLYSYLSGKQKKASVGDPTSADVAALQTTGGPSQAEAMHALLRLGLTGLVAGAGYRGATGLLDMVKPEEETKQPAIGPRPMVVRLKRPRHTAPVAFQKAADVMDEIGNWFKGLYHQNYVAKPLFLPAAATAVLGGGYAGYKGIDSMLARQRKAENERRLQQAKDTYQKALMQEFEAGEKIAGERTLEQDLDLLARRTLEKMPTTEKQADMNDLLGAGTGAYLTAALGLSGLSGLAAYNWTKAQSPAAQINKAIKQRERMRWLQRPPEIYFVHDNEDKVPQLAQNEKAAFSLRGIARLYR